MKLTDLTGDKNICQICDHVQPEVEQERYGEWVCASCGQQHEYDEGQRPVLTEAQLSALRGLRG